MDVPLEILLGIVLVICVLMLAAILGHLVAVRRRLVTRTDVFWCKVRVTSGATPQLSPRWPLRACRAEWKHDVLLLHCGVWLTWAYPLAVRFAEGVIEPARPISRFRMVSGAVMLRLRLDDDTMIAVAAPAGAWEQLAGPFLAIAAQGMSPDISQRSADRHQD
jgi:hypothetical protein